MERFSSFLILGPNGLAFGKYPTDEELDIILKEGYHTVVNLCTDDEIDPKLAYDHIKVPLYFEYPILDRTPPKSDGSFGCLVEELVSIYNTNSTPGASLPGGIYVHCRGGHGRSAVVAGVLYYEIMRLHSRKVALTSDALLKRIYEAHQKRLEMKPRWRSMGAPQTKAQKKFILDWCA